MTPIPIPCPHCGSVLKIRDPEMIGKKAKCPKCTQVFRLQMLASVGAAAGSHPQERSVGELPLMSAAAASPAEMPNFVIAAEPVGVAGQLKAQRKKRRQRFLVSACISAVVLLAGGLAAFYVVRNVPEKLPLELAAEGEMLEGDADTEAAGSLEESSNSTAAEPIDLKYIPAGTRIVVHIHPAELWKPDSQEEEFRFCLGPLGEFVAAKIKELSKREPVQVADALFCVIPNERGTAPDLAAVFQLAEEAKKSQLLDDFGGRRMESSDGFPYYLTDERAYLFPDLKTIVSVPAKLAEDMIAAAQHIQPTSEGIDELLFLTDKTRPVTVLLDPVATQIDADFLMPPGAIPFLEQFVEFLGPEVETVGWSILLQKEQFRSEILVRNKGGLESKILERDLRRKLDRLASDVLTLVKRMTPRELGQRKIIGRVPAMTRAFTLATRTEPGPRYVKLVTRLPERAAPNLALGTLLAWNESTRLAKETSPKPSSGDTEKPDNTPIAEKLKRKITVEFKREPLAQAFAYIANEIKAKLDVDGDGLKLSAYTKNMPQSFALENTPAIDVIKKILKQPMYEKMCLVVDDKQNSLLITTYPVAEQKGLKPYVFPE